MFSGHVTGSEVKKFAQISFSNLETPICFFVIRQTPVTCTFFLSIFVFGFWFEDNASYFTSLLRCAGEWATESLSLLNFCSRTEPTNRTCWSWLLSWNSVSHPFCRWFKGYREEMWPECVLSKGLFLTCCHSATALEWQHFKDLFRLYGHRTLSFRYDARSTTTELGILCNHQMGLSAISVVFPPLCLMMWSSLLQRISNCLDCSSNSQRCNASTRPLLTFNPLELV